MIAALYVQRGGTYYGLNNIDPWDESRDARRSSAALRPASCRRRRRRGVA